MVTLKDKEGVPFWARDVVQPAIADLNQTISATYSQAELQAISDKVDALLAALRSAGLLES